MTRVQPLTLDRGLGDLVPRTSYSPPPRLFPCRADLAFRTGEWYLYGRTRLLRRWMGCLTKTERGSWHGDRKGGCSD